MGKGVFCPKTKVKNSVKIKRQLSFILLDLRGAYNSSRDVTYLFLCSNDFFGFCYYFRPNYYAMNPINPKSALIFILVTICLDSIGLGIIIPSFPTLIAETAHLPLGKASQYFGWVMVAYAFMQFVFSPLIGNLSDRYGRRPVLLISVLGMSMDYMVMFYAPDLFWLVLGRAISGIFGASFTSAAAYRSATKANR